MKQKETLETKITVLGGGAFGTAFSQLLAGNGHSVTLWCFEEAVVEEINKKNLNSKFFPGIELDKKIKAVSSLENAIDDSEIIFAAIPVSFLRKVLTQAKSFCSNEQIWCLLSKGIEDETSYFSYQVVEDVFGSDAKVVALGGPNFAEQLAARIPSGALAASRDLALAEKVKNICCNDWYNVETSTDIAGLQVCGAMKNVVSLFLGMVNGAGYKDNTEAFLLAKSFSEIGLVIDVLGGTRETLFSTAGIGDLMLGLMGKKSRNFEVGALFGKGSTLQEISSDLHVLPEGVNGVKAIYKMIQRKDLRLPICAGLYGIIFENKSMRALVGEIYST